MMTSNVDRMVAAALARAGSETLVKRLREGSILPSFRGGNVVNIHTIYEAADRIEQLERELSEQVNKKVGYYNDWIAEKALADELLRLVNDDGGDRESVRAAYRKARGV